MSVKLMKIGIVLVASLIPWTGSSAKDYSFQDVSPELMKCEAEEFAYADLEYFSDTELGGAYCMCAKKFRIAMDGGMLDWAKTSTNNMDRILRIMRKNHGLGSDEKPNCVAKSQ